MTIASSNSRTRVLGIGAILLVLAGLSTLWFTQRTPTATPGPMPAVPPADRATPLPPSEGIVVPSLSPADAARVKRGESVTIEVPGGQLKIGPPKKGERK